MNKLKKVIVLMMAGIMALSLTACVGPSSKNSVSKLETSEEAPTVAMADYTNDFDGIVDYMKDMELIAGDGVSMSADYIGAVAGEKFTYTYKDATMTCEIYEFDQENPSETATRTIASAKETGTITVIGTEIDVVLSDSEKFMMVFVNASDEETFTDYNAKIVEDFKVFVGA